MSYTELSKIINAITEVIGDIFIVGGTAMLIVIGKAIYRTYRSERS